MRAPLCNAMPAAIVPVAGAHASAESAHAEGRNCVCRGHCSALRAMRPKRPAGGATTGRARCCAADATASQLYCAMDNHVLLKMGGV